jgi:hypothetical protein
VGTSEQRVKFYIVVTAVLAVAAIVLSSIALARGPSSSSTTSGLPASGIYVNGSADRPHFFLVLTNLGAGLVRGSVDFQYQDGQTSLGFSFRGTSQLLRSGSSTGALTMTPVTVPVRTSSELFAPPPKGFSATFGPGDVDLGECGTFLHVTSEGACQFSLSKAGAP